MRHIIIELELDSKEPLQTLAEDIQFEINNDWSLNAKIKRIYEPYELDAEIKQEEDEIDVTNIMKDLVREKLSKKIDEIFDEVKFNVTH